VTGAGAPKPHVASPGEDHYSYALYADPATAEGFDALRFGGPIGRLVAESQEQVIASFLDPIGGRHILDVGTGTGRAAIALTPGWQQALGELCRVARDLVVFDYPAVASAAALQASARKVALAAGVDVEAYRVFSDRAIARALGAHGFRIRDRHRQFVLPIALHKRLNSVAATERLESWLASLGLRSLIGSPVTVVAERCAS
jgi:hypothetical protein